MLLIVSYSRAVAGVKAALVFYIICALFNFGISIVNTPGTVDAGYRGELQVILINHDLTESISFKKGDRIAQLVIQQVERAEFIEVADLPGSERSTGGFGSTGA